jgi:hypothetical protein
MLRAAFARAFTDASLYSWSTCMAGRHILKHGMALPCHAHKLRSCVAGCLVLVRFDLDCVSVSLRVLWCVLREGGCESWRQGKR